MVMGSRVDGNLVHVKDGRREAKASEVDSNIRQQTEQETRKPTTVTAVKSKSA